MEKGTEGLEPRESTHKVQYGYHRGNVRLPVIRLKGKYLAKLGFGVGDNINVKVSKGRIVITKA